MVYEMFGCLTIAGGAAVMSQQQQQQQQQVGLQAPASFLLLCWTHTHPIGYIVRSNVVLQRIDQRCYPGS
jgi:hypothetical protein